MLTNLCYDLLDTIKLEIGGGSGFEVLEARAKTLKGLLELLRGNAKTGMCKRSINSFLQCVTLD